jgi:hypothetical protein
MSDIKIDAKHRRTLEELFAHPISMNIDFWKVVNLFEDLDADVTDTKHDHVKVKLNGVERSFARPHKKNIDSKDEVMAIRNFLKEAGVTPETVTM